jgi:hypothetical protein
MVTAPKEPAENLGEWMPTTTVESSRSWLVPCTYSAFGCSYWLLIPVA